MKYNNNYKTPTNLIIIVIVARCALLLIPGAVDRAGRQRHADTHPQSYRGLDPRRLLPNLSQNRRHLQLVYVCDHLRLI